MIKKRKVIVKRNGQFMLDEMSDEELLQDLVIDDIIHKKKCQYLRLSNGVEIKCGDFMRNYTGISAWYKEERIYQAPSTDINTVLSTINSFKDNSRKDLDGFLEENLSSEIQKLNKNISELKTTQNMLKENINKLENIKNSMRTLVEQVENFLTSCNQ